jgi:hypothetical protein
MPESTFDLEFKKNYKTVEDLFVKSPWFSSIYHYSRGLPQHQLIGEYTVGLMIYQNLISQGWCCNIDPLGLSGNPGNRDFPNEWHYTRDGKTLLVIMGDGIVNVDGKSFDYAVTDSCQFFEGVDTFHVNPEIYGLHENVIEHTFEDREPTKLFNCFMSSPSVSRQNWLYEFCRRGMLDQGNVSYLVNSKHEPSMGRTPENVLGEFDGFFRGTINEIFSKEHLYLRKKLPYKNFDCTLEDAIIDSKVSVVVETEYPNPGQLFFTEKTFRAILMPRPFLIMASGQKTGGIEYLRSLGFDVYDDIIDHSYDLEPDPVPRMGLILNQLQKNLSGVVFDQKLRRKLHHRVQHNHDLIRKFRRELSNKYSDLLCFIGKIRRIQDTRKFAH